jgi:hypothetical protein
LVVKKVVDSRYRYNIANANLGIGDPMQLVVDGHLIIELLDIDWQKFPANTNNACQWLADLNNVTNVLQMLAYVYPMVTNVQKNGTNKHELAREQVLRSTGLSSTIQIEEKLFDDLQKL